MSEIQNLSEFCLKCEAQKKYRDGTISLSEARNKCKSCKKSGLYKFDIVYTLIETKSKRQQLPKGKKETYSKRYGAAVSNLQEQGKTVREIAKILGISPTSVIKIQKKLKAAPTENKACAAEELEDQIFFDDK